MTYCKFSTNNWSCDLYVHRSGHGTFVTQIARSRIAGNIPKLPPLSEGIDAYWSATKVQSYFLDTAAREPIDLPHAGEGFVDATASECADRLESLRALGYNVPQCPIDALRKEAATGEGV